MKQIGALNGGCQFTIEQCSRLLLFDVVVKTAVERSVAWYQCTDYFEVSTQKRNQFKFDFQEKVNSLKSMNHCLAKKRCL